MSSLWTPGGEVPVDRNRPTQPSAEPAATSAPDASAASAPAGGPDGPTEDELRAHAEQLQQLYLQTPAADIVAQHAMGLYELAVVHLSQDPPDLPQGRLAIDALAALVDGLGSRLGSAEAELASIKTQLQMAFVQMSGGGDSAEGPQSSTT